MLAGTCNDKRNNTVGHDIGPIYPRECVDDLLVRLANFVFGDLSSHGIVDQKPVLSNSRLKLVDLL